MPGQDDPIREGSAFSAAGGEVDAEGLDGWDNACDVSGARPVKLWEVTSVDS